MSPSEVRIRTAQRGDYERIGELTAAAYIEGGHMRPQDRYMEHLHNVADRAERATLLVAEVDGQVAGSVTVTDYQGPYAEVARPGELEFRMLAVAPEYQGRGIARQLVRHIVSEAESRPDIRGITLCSLASMTRAHELYRSEGFVADPGRDFVLMTSEVSARFPFFSRLSRTDQADARLAERPEGVI